MGVPVPLILVTGGSRGLGAALGQQALAAGQRVIEFSRAAPHPHSVAADLADPLAFRATLLRTLGALPAEALQGGVTLIHNAGVVTPIGPAGGDDAAALLANLQANFSGALLGLAAVVQALQGLKAPKRLLNISSGAAQRPIAGWSAYCAAKAGLEHWLRTVAAEQATEPAPWTLVNVNPGVMDTGMQADIRAAAFPDQALFVQRHAEGRLQDPAAVAARVLALAERADLRNGERYDVAA
jgi:benzil reductase ((S)-benzoin forming)